MANRNCRKGQAPPPSPPIWLSIGLHIGWNFFEGVVFGFLVSGLDIYALTRIRVFGPTMWTEGSSVPKRD